ncbi:hypothetical protein OESDEN_05986 [Oesophagostomum dentatum]|uniref:Uncharacterized protein n=1 Tax=Oesophagostomum dentatum TaxID=61180 RepID=A0A0B1TA19_OESDE|nr:hypothetical protein OESDEN_05986 [Oesophagostomum dentatum]
MPFIAMRRLVYIYPESAPTMCQKPLTSSIAVALRVYRSKVQLV